jgi:glycosyltransferase EpsJ
MENQYTVSIIMPVYRVEQYIARSIESMLHQTWADFEFLIVDDGSPDRSGELCDAYAKNDSRITVFHTGNQGAALARNFAIPKASGKYLYFMDADDWAEPTMLEDMVRIAEQSEAQCVIAGYYIDTYYDTDRFMTTSLLYPSRMYDSAQVFREEAHFLFDKNLLYTPWNKLYRRDYILSHNIVFPDTFWDDFPFNLAVFRDIERVAVTEKQYYHFIRQRAESETAKYNPNMYEKRKEENEWMLELYRHWGIENPTVKEFLARRHIERILGCFENITNKNSGLSRRAMKQAIRVILEDPQVETALRDAEPRSVWTSLLLVPIRRENISWIYLQSRFISFIKAHNVKLFALLKANR